MNHEFRYTGSETIPQDVTHHKIEFTYTGSETIPQDVTHLYCFSNLLHLPSLPGAKPRAMLNIFVAFHKFTKITHRHTPHHPVV